MATAAVPLPGNWHDWRHGQLLSRKAEETLKKEAGFKKQDFKKSN